jgi:hypothetical protein
VNQRRWWGISRSLICLAQFPLLAFVVFDAARHSWWIMEYIAFGLMAFFIVFLFCLTLPAAIIGDR